MCTVSKKRAIKVWFAGGRLWAAFLLAMALVAVISTPTVTSAQDASNAVNVSPDQARAIARQALANGNLALAEGVATALLTRNPNDAEALLLRAVISRTKGDFETAYVSARSAYDASDNSDLKFDAAFLIASLEAKDENFTRAQIWLRRADNVASTEARRRAVENTYREVKRRNPLSVQLAFTVRPSDNINGGSTVEETGVFGLPGSIDDPIAALEISGSAVLSYKLAESSKGLTQAYTSIFARRAILESGYEDIVPGTTSTEYDYAALTFGLEYRSRPFPDIGVTTLRVGYSAGYYRNEHFLSAADVAVTQQFRLSDERSVRAGVTLRDEHRFDSPISSTFNTVLSVDYFPKSSDTLAWSVGTTLTNYNSQANTVNGHRVELRTRLNFKQELLGARPDLSLSVAWRDLPDFDYFGTLDNGRQDISASVRAGLTFTEISYFGFQPRAEVGWNRTNSEVDLWDTESLSLGVTAVSRF